MAPTTRPAISSTRTARDLLAGVRSHLTEARRDLRELADDLEALRSDLASDWRYLRADIADDLSGLAYRARTDLEAWRDRRRQAPALTPTEWQCTSCHQTYRTVQPGCPNLGRCPEAGRPWPSRTQITQARASLDTGTPPEPTP